MGRLTEYFGRVNQRSTRHNHKRDLLPDHIHPLTAPRDALIDRIRRMKVNPAKVAERKARERMAAFPGPLATTADPPGCSARVKAARKAVRALMAMKAEGQTAKLTKRFDSACKVIDDEDGDLGPIIRNKVFDWIPSHEPTEAELQRTTICKRIDGDMTIMDR